MNRRPILVCAAVVAVVAAIVIAIGVNRRRAPATISLPAGSLRGANVLLVTIDTLRVDRVGAYGSERRLTPTLDQLADSGLRFSTAYAHVPLTLPSHASLMTASYPTRNGVRDNGTFRLGSGPPTLATALKAAGYRTAAFVGAFVLDARFGLDRGFDTYDDRMPGRSQDLDLVQRDARQVLAPAYEWIVQRGASDPRAPAPWFAWAHLYDPHEPYNPPEPYRSRYAGAPYDGEVAYTDAELGAFLTRLRAAGALAQTLVIVVSDHGESLGEHGERTHGLFAYDSTLRVPLILSAPGVIARATFEPAMRLVDLAPTVLDLVGVAPFSEADGRSVRPFVAGERRFDDPGSYFEAMNANFTRNWAPLSGMVRDYYKLVDLPLPELYDLAGDAGEMHNVYATRRDRARELEAVLDRISRSAAPPTPASIDADAQARLRSLGYVVSSVAPRRNYTAADDPKRLVHLNAALDDAAGMWTRGDGARAIETLRVVLRERPDLTVAYDRLAFMLRESGRASDAVAVLDEAARRGSADRPLLRSLGSALRDAGDLRRSAAVLEPLVRGDPADLDSADALAQTYVGLGRGRDAEGLYKRIIADSPHDAAAWNNLGSVYLGDGRLEDARAALVRAIELDPALAGAHNGLGVVYARSGDVDRAVSEWKKALELRPDLADARSNLERVRK